MFRRETYNSDGTIVKVEERDWTPEEALQEWQSKIAATDAKLPRYVEDLIDMIDSKIPIKSDLPVELMIAYNDKKSLRLQKPKG